ncbi:MAG: VOC family protein [Ignavibacteria bacterium]
MNKNFKPEGYNSVSPYFIVNGAQKFIDLMKQIFNVKDLRKYEMPDGTIIHAEIQIEDSVIMIGDSSERFPPNTHLIHVYVEDVDETFRKALASGCTSDDPPIVKEGEPDKRGTFKDFAGNYWSVSTQQ